VLGNAPGLNYASDYRNVSGVVVPTKRRVFAYDSEKRKIPGAPLVAIDAGRSLRKVFEFLRTVSPSTCGAGTVKEEPLEIGRF